MISIIICSINPEQNNVFTQNIKQTIGVPYELLVHDNRGINWGLCKVYNHYAGLSKYDILCFFHEDIQFFTPNWGKIIFDFFKEKPKSGVIGFAGSTIKTKYITGWGSLRKTTRRNLIQAGQNDTKKSEINPFHENFSSVTLLDGMALICTKNVWKENLFDDKTFKRFHLYDLDFTLNVAQHHTNYVCYTIKVKHLSNGSYTKEWLSESQKFIEKWNSILPFSIMPYSQKFIRKCEEYDMYQMARTELKLTWDELSFKSILTKHRQVNTFLYKLKLIKHIIKAIQKKYHKT